MVGQSVVIWWLRRDLRLKDNLALGAALDSGSRVLPVFIFDPALLKGERFSVARLKFMLAALESLDADLRERSSGILVRNGNPLTVLPTVVEEFGVSAVYANADYSPYAVKRDRAMAKTLPVPLNLYDDALLHAPDELLKKDGTPYVVFTPYQRKWSDLQKPEPLQYVIHAGQLHDLGGFVCNLPTLHELGFENHLNLPEASEGEASRRLDLFVKNALLSYGDGRNAMAINPLEDEADGTSGLSPYFRFGMLSPRQAYHAARESRVNAQNAQQRDSVDTWIGELAWREFYMHILYHFPQGYNTSFYPKFEQVEYRNAPDDLKAWQEGQTGYPIVDAAMRQMNMTGWMHNRARMIASNFLTKDLLIYWREGDVYFMKHLIDGDPAANNGGWQWAGGTGPSAQPYFRIFNPVIQSKKFDPDGAYIRRWIPELVDVPKKYIHEPWKMKKPPKDYPPPIIEHDVAKARALAMFKVLKCA